MKEEGSMGNTAKKTEDITWSDIRVMFAEAANLAKANEKSLKALNAKLDRIVEIEMEERKLAAKEREKERKLEIEEREKAAKEREKERKLEAEEREKAAKEREKAAKEREISMKKLEATVEKTSKSVFELSSEVKGIGKSNGMIAEEYFYNSIYNLLTFGGHHFDFSDRHLKRKRTNKDGKTVQAEYDILMGNDVAACIMEVKYRARINNVNELIDKVDKFRIHFPTYANHKLFLGIGALSFDEGVEDAAKARGIGILKLNGDAVEVYDKNLKVY
jgi:hypothetical protein